MKSPGSFAQVGRVAFELSRFDVVGDCYEVEGQWFGVRGRRFMRPALTVVVDGRPIRLLADLAGKPWAVEDGEPWTATFPYTFERARSREAELTVAPDVTITLPTPARLATAATRKSASRHADASRQRGDTDALTRELADLRDTERRLRQQLDRMEADKRKTAQRLEEVSRELRELDRRPTERSVRSGS